MKLLGSVETVFSFEEPPNRSAVVATLYYSAISTE